MKDNTQIFKDYSVPKAVATLAVPSIVGMLVNVIYNLADTFFVGQTNDPNQVAAVSITMPLFFMFIAFGNLFGVGGCAFVSRSLGEGRQDRVKSISAFAIYSSIAAGIVLGAVYFLFREPILLVVGASKDSIGYASGYLKYIALGSPIIVFNVMAGNLVRGEGAAKKSMAGMLIGTITNIVLDPIFILSSGDKIFGFDLPFGLGMGVIGAAVATVIGNVASSVYYAAYLLGKKSILSASPKRYTLKNGIAKGVLFVGAPAAFNNLLMSLSNMFVNVFLQSYGDAAVAAMGVAMKANSLVIMMQIGLAQGIQPLIGYCYGAKNYNRLNKTVRFGCLCNIILGTVISLVYYLNATNVISVFIGDVQVIEYGVKMLKALTLSGPVIGCMFVLNFAFQGMGKGLQSMFLSVGRQGLVYLPLLFLMHHFVGLDGIIWAQPTADFACIITSVILYLFVLREMKSLKINANELDG